MRNTKKIFISYGRDKDHPEHVLLVQKIKSDLEQNGFTAFMDIDRLETSKDWEIQLETDIEACDFALFCATPYSARRPDGYCLNELSYALYKRKTIIPIMLDQIMLPLSICRLQYIDFQDYNTRY